MAALAMGCAWTPSAMAEPSAPASGRSAASIMDIRVDDPALMGRRAELLARAEAALARGEVAAANEDFDRASMMLHAADTEMGLVRTAMQAGQYRRALAFAAHVAGAHREAPEAGALYAWLLALSGQQAFAERVLQEAQQVEPGNEIVRETREALAGPHPRTRALLLRTPHRMAPTPGGLPDASPVPAAATVVGSGVLIDQGRRALVPLSVLRRGGLDASPASVWVRDGLGQAREARPDLSLPGRAALEAEGVAVLRLSSPLTLPKAVPWAPREPFGGSAGFALDHAPGGGEPAWPWQRAGFLGPLPREAGPRPLGIALGDGLHGGPVLDAQGRLVGMALPDAGRGALLLPVSRWRQAGLVSDTEADASAAPMAGVAAAESTGTARAADEIYETGMRVALQVLMLDPLKP